MNRNNSGIIILALSMPLSILLVIVSCTGLLTPDFYSKETLNWQAQSVGQDMIDMFLVAPCLGITAILSFKKSRLAISIWGGVALYLTYTFVIYCFDIHFNKLFIFYCLALGLSFYSTLYFLFLQQKENNAENFRNKSVSRFIAIYFIAISILFYLLWLSEILPAISKNTIPTSVTEAGLFTNAVHVLDLAVILPCIFLTGIFLLKKIPIAFAMVPVILTFFILMDITIGFLALVMKMKGIESNLMLTVIMSLLALLSLALLIWYLKSQKT